MGTFAHSPTPPHIPNHRPRARVIGLGLAVLVSLLAWADPAHAAICRWTGLAAGNDNQWSNGDNWDCNGQRRPPADNDFLVFGEPAAKPANVNDLDAGLDVLGVEIRGRGDTGPWNITGNAIDLQGDLVVSSPQEIDGNGPLFLAPINIDRRNLEEAEITNNAAAQEGQGPLTLGDIALDGRTSFFNGASPITVSGSLSCSARPVELFKTGPSVLTLNHNSCSTLQTAVFTGTLRAHATDAFGGIEALVTIDGGVLDLSDGVVLHETIEMGDNSGTVMVAPGASATLAGGTHLGGGIAVVGGTLTISGRLVAIDPLESVTKTGGGTLILTNTANAWNELSVREGTLRVGAAGALSSTGTLSLSRGQAIATLDLNGFDATIGTLAGGEGGRVLLGARTLTVDTLHEGVYAGSIAGTGNLVKSGAGALLLDGATPNAYTGTTTMQAGLLVLSKTAINGTIVGPLVVTGGEVRWGAGEQVADHVAVAVNDPGTLHFSTNSPVNETIGSLSGNGLASVQDATLTVGANNASTTFAGVLMGRHTQGGPQEAQFRLVKIGTGTLTLAGINTPNEQLVVDAGTLLVDGQSSGTRVLVRGGVLGGTGTLLDNSSRDTFNTISVAGGAISPGPDPRAPASSTATPPISSRADRWSCSSMAPRRGPATISSS